MTAALPQSCLPQSCLADSAIRPGDTSGTASALQSWLGGAAADWAPAGVNPFALVHVAEQAPLIHQGSPARCVYLVQAGHFKIVHTGEDGYEHVLAFAGRHELLGCDGLADGHHATSVVALEESWAFALPLGEVQRLCQRVPAFSARWQQGMAAQISRAGDMAWLMAAVGAEKRTARFVILYARRMAAGGQSPRRLLLRMGRRDIASHLGLAHESVSRSFSTLAELGLLRVDNREIEILDSEALHRFALSTRGYPEPPARRPRPDEADRREHRERRATARAAVAATQPLAAHRAEALPA